MKSTHDANFWFSRKFFEMKLVLLIRFSFWICSLLQVAASSYFTYHGFPPVAPHVCTFHVYNLAFQSKTLCAVYCAQNLLCNAFDTCFSDGISSCRLRYGLANSTGNHSSVCDHYKMKTVSIK